jgi:phosphatidylserine decarboxylase
MATTAPEVTPLSSATSPTSIQPGGAGWCTRLELAWGRGRRAFLRRCRPGYVRAMLGKRQGDCPGCPHDIIDSRDLKYWRNVCGYWFRLEDDRFRWRDRLWLARPGLAEVVIFTLLALVLALPLAAFALFVHPSGWAPLGILGVVWVWMISFFRDPERPIPEDPRALLSPADGTVTFVGEVPAPDFPGEKAFCISIFLSIFNVHVNRVPRTSRVQTVRYFRGSFLDARHPDCAARNEQLWIDFEEVGSGGSLRVKQISGAIARRIVCWLRPGETVRAGERFGMIKFGSRTEVLAPVEAFDVRVKVGDKVKGGATVLWRYPQNDKVTR